MRMSLQKSVNNHEDLRTHNVNYYPIGCLMIFAIDLTLINTLRSTVVCFDFLLYCRFPTESQYFSPLADFNSFLLHYFSSTHPKKILQAWLEEIKLGKRFCR